MFKPLRDKILELAITGKLVPQLESEPAVEQIGPAPAKDEEPFALPEKWKWVRLGLLGSWKSGQTPKRTEQSYWVSGSISWLKTGELNDGVISFSEEKISQKAVDDLNIRVNPVDSVLIAMYGATAGRLGVLSTPCATNQACCACIVDTQLLVNWFLFYVLLAFRAELIGMATGTAQSNLSKEKIEALWFPLPPLEEQRRIVAKLDDIMGNLERMDQAYTELSGPMLKHFKNLVLQQAISGQLVPQLDSEPAVEQLGPAPKPEEVPFAIPEKWKWVALEDLFQFVDYRGKTPIKSASGVRLITSSNVRKGYLDHTRCEYISIDEYQSRQSRGVSHKGDILFTTEAPLGNVALADLDVFSVGQRVITLKSKGLALNECFVWFLLSNYFQTEILKQATGSTVQGIKAARLKKLVLPLPPIEEQKRIAARINKLFAEADKLLALKELSL